MKIRTTFLAGALILFAQLASADLIDYTCTDCPLLIPPSGTAGLTLSTLPVADMGEIADLTIFIDAFHTFEGDLEISLIHLGTTEILQSRINGSDDYTGGTYVTTLFGGAELGGDWVLSIDDQLGADSGILRSWSMSGNYTPVPEPGTLALFGLGLACLGLRRRRSAKA